MSDKTSVYKGSKPVESKTRSVTRTMTAATALMTLPKGSRIIGIVFGGVASDAGTTATVSVGTTVGGPTEFLNARDVKTAGTGTGNFWISDHNAASVLSTDTVVYGLYAETGTASAAGQWEVSILYTTGNSINNELI